MRSFLLVVLACSACGRDSLPLPPGAPTPGAAGRSNRIKLESTFERSDGFRFADRAVLTTNTLPNARCPVEEVRDVNGALVEGEAASTDLQTDSGRYLVVSVPGGSLCVTPPVGSLAEVDERLCTGWTPQHLLHLSFHAGENASGKGLIVRTARDEAYRVWIAQSGFDEVARTDSVVFDFEARPAPAQCSATTCVVRDDCCNGRHSCKAGVCEY